MRKETISDLTTEKTELKREIGAFLVVLALLLAS